MSKEHPRCQECNQQTGAIGTGGEPAPIHSAPGEEKKCPGSGKPTK